MITETDHMFMRPPKNVATEEKPVGFGLASITRALTTWAELLDFQGWDRLIRIILFVPRRGPCRELRNHLRDRSLGIFGPGVCCHENVGPLGCPVHGSQKDYALGVSCTLERAPRVIRVDNALDNLGIDNFPHDVDNLVVD